MNRLHLVYGESGAAVLRLALSDLGLTDSVMAFPEVLQYAPLFADFERDSICSYAKRCAQIVGLSDTDCERLGDAMSRFFNCVLTSYDEVVVWYGSSAGDRLFYYMVSAWTARNLAEVNIEPLREMLFNPNVRDITMALCSVDNARQLLQFLRPLSKHGQQRNAGMWQKFSLSDASLRVSNPDGGIDELGEDSFDNQIIEACRGEWRAAARVVGRLLCQVSFVVGDSFLHRRIVKLAGEKKIAVRGSQQMLGRSSANEQCVGSILIDGVDVGQLRLFDVKS